MSVSARPRFGRGWPRVFRIIAGQLALLLATLVAAEALLHVADRYSGLTLLVSTEDRLRIETSTTAANPARNNLPYRAAE